MKNLHYLKKFVVMVLAAMMTLSTFALPTFAANGSITLTDLEPGVTPTAYRLVDVKTNDSVTRIKDAQGEEIVSKSDLVDPYNPTTDEILKLAANTPAGLPTYAGTTVAAGQTTATLSNLPPGIYLVKFASTGTVKYVYNPVIVSIKNDGTAVAGNLDDYNDETDANGKPKAKKSTVTLDKVVERTEGKLPEDKGSNLDNTNTFGDELGANSKVNADPQDGNDGNRGDTAEKGALVSFRVNTKIPYYGDNYFSDFGANKTNANFKKPQFQIYDDLDGLTLDTNSVKVYANNNFTTPLVKDTDYTITFKTATVGDEEVAVGYEIKLNESAIKTHRGCDIEVRYSATVNDNADRVNFNPDTNTAGCKYSNNPNSDTLAETDKRTTYHYKFTINGKIKGNSGKENREVLKVGIDENTGQQLFVEQSSGIVDLPGWKVLKDVKFSLYDNEQGSGDAIRPVKSDKDGILRGMDQLDAGTYWLIEDADQPQFEGTGDYAADKYKPNRNPIKIEIIAKLRDDGRLDSYMVKVADTVVGNYKANYTVDADATEGTKTVQIAGDFYEVDAVGTDAQVGDGDEIIGINKNHNIKVNGEIKTYTDDDKAVEILNTKTGTLPSTGGMGTVLFTIGGIAIMGLALLLLFGGKKKQHQK